MWYSQQKDTLYLDPAEVGCVRTEVSPGSAEHPVERQQVG